MILAYQVNQSRRPALLDVAPVRAPVWEPQSIAVLRAGFSHPAMREAIAGAPDIDLSLVTHHSGDDVAPFFRSLARQDFPLRKIRLLITRHAEDAREDELLEDTLALHGASFKDVVIQRQDNVGYGGGHNRNFAASQADLFLISNIDVDYREDTLCRLVYAMMTAPADVATVEARQYPFEHIKFYDPGTLETLWSSGCCLLARSAAFRKVGGFDPAFFMYGEDVDLSLRLRSAGYRTAFCPWAALVHAPPQEPRRELMHRGAIESALFISAKFGRWREVARMLATAASLAVTGQEGFERRNARTALRRFARHGAGMLLQRGQFRSFGANLFNGLDFEWRRPFRLTAADLEDALRRPPSTGHPLVSIVIRATREERIVERALRSALFQTYPAIEVILVEDGGSKLGALVGRYRDASFDVRWLPVEPVGRTVAANVGLAWARGEYVVLLDDDDYLFLDHVESLQQVLHEDADFAVAWSAQGVRHDPDDFLDADSFALPPWHARILDLDWFARENCLTMQSVLFRRRDALRVGGLDTGLKAWEDWNFFSRLLRSGTVPVVTRTTSMFFVPDDGPEKDARDHEFHIGHAPALAANRRWRAQHRAEQASIALVYHRIGARDFDPYSLFVGPAHIAQHVDVVADRRSLLRDDLTIEIHFDDGYRDVLDAALAATRAPGVAVKAFVTSGFVFEARPFHWDRLNVALCRSNPDHAFCSALAAAIGVGDRQGRQLYVLALERCRTNPAMLERVTAVLDAFEVQAPADDVALTVPELARLAQSGVEIGLHGHSHRSFGFMTEDDCRHEIDRSIAALSRVVPNGRPASFAFPHGSQADLGEAAAMQLWERGVTRLYSMEPREISQGQARILPRWQVGDLDGVDFRVQLDALIGLAFGPGEARAASAAAMRRAPRHPSSSRAGP